MNTIYFIAEGPISGRHTKLNVKVGFTTGKVQGGEKSRMYALQIANPRELVLIGTLRGDRAKEKRLHKFLAPLHIRGEWYLLSEAEIEAIIKKSKVTDIPPETRLRSAFADVEDISVTARKLC